MPKKVIDMIAMVLVIIGALNWGLVGLNSFSEVSYGWDLVNAIFGSLPWLAAIVYLLVALAGIWMIVMWVRMSKSHKAAPVGTSM